MDTILYRSKLDTEVKNGDSEEGSRNRPNPLHRPEPVDASAMVSRPVKRGCPYTACIPANYFQANATAENRSSTNSIGACGSHRGSESRIIRKPFKRGACDQGPDRARVGSGRVGACGIL
jgi:hypothetical protein